MLSGEPPPPAPSDRQHAALRLDAAGPADADPDLGHTSGSSVVSGGMWSILSRTVPQIQLLVISIVAARFLGPDGMGRQSYIAFVGLSVVMVATAGLPASVSRFIGELLGARKGGVALGLYTWTWRIEIVAGALAGATMVAAALLGAEPEAAWLLAGAAAALAVLQSVPQSLLSGAQQWRQATVVGVVTGVLAVPVTIAVLAAGGGIVGFFAVELVVIAVNLTWTSHLARRLTLRLPPREPVPADLRRRFVSFAGVSTALVLIQYVVWRRSELLVLERVSVDAQVALYSIAFAVVSGLQRVPEAISKVTMPAVATLIGAGEHDRVRAGFWRAMRLLAFATPPVVAGAAVTGPGLISAAYGEEFAGAGDLLLVLLAPLILLPMLTTSEALLFAMARVRFLFVVGMVATVVDLGLAILLIPRLDAMGAAIANAAAQLVAGIPALVLACRLLRPLDLAWGPLVRGLALSVVIAAASGGVLLVVGSAWFGVVAAMLAGLVVFALLAPVLRPLAHDDAAWLASSLGVGGGHGLRAVLGRTVLRLAPRR